MGQFHPKWMKNWWHLADAGHNVDDSDANTSSFQSILIESKTIPRCSSWLRSASTVTALPFYTKSASVPISELNGAMPDLIVFGIKDKSNVVDTNPAMCSIFKIY